MVITFFYFYLIAERSLQALSPSATPQQAIAPTPKKPVMSREIIAVVSMVRSRKILGLNLFEFGVELIYYECLKAKMIDELLYGFSFCFV
ncbi:MAG: hypothetical protein ACYTXI_39265 [Nostoc sp.]